MKSMKLLMAAIIIACIIFYVMYLWDFALVLLIIMTVLPIIMLISVIYIKHNVSVSFYLNEDSAVKNQDFPVQLIVENKGLLPVGKSEAEIEYYNVFNNEINSFKVYFPIQATNSQSITFDIRSKFCGIVNVSCAYVRIYDPMRIFSFRIAKKLNTEIPVMPEGHEISGEISFTDRVNEDSQLFSVHKAGDDPSEVFDLRDYNPGDRLNRIHWKLSSKKDDLVVKDYSLPVDIPSTVFLNLKCYEKTKYTLPVFDTLIETLVSVSKFMLENERSHTIVYYNEKNELFMEILVRNLEDLSYAVRDIIYSVTDNAGCEIPEQYFTENNELSLSSLTFISSMPDTDIMTMLDENADAEIKNALIVVKTPEEADSLNEQYAELRVLPVVMGKISSCIRDIIF